LGERKSEVVEVEVDTLTSVDIDG